MKHQIGWGRPRWLILTLVIGIVSCAPPRGAPSQQAGMPPSGATGWEAVVAAGRQEGRVIVGVPPGPQYQPAITASFEKAYPGIEVEMVNIHAAEFTARIAKERAAGEFGWDVWIGGPDVDVYRLAREGVFDPVKPEITAAEILDDAKWLGGFDAGFSDAEKKYTYNFGAINTGGGFVNRDFIPEPDMTKYEDLWDPRWRGKIVWQDPRQAGSGVNSAAVILHVYGEEKLRELWTNQQPAISTDERQMAEWVVRGRHPIGVGLVANRGLDLLKREGLGLNVMQFPFPIALAIPGSHNVVAINRPPHPNARKVFLNWLLNQEGQRVMSESISWNSRRLDVPIMNPEQEVPAGAKAVNTQAEEFAPLRTRANEIAKEIFR